MKRIFLSMGIGILIMATICYADSMNQQLSDHVLRLHVIANSNSKRDQELKFAVRDAVISKLNLLISDYDNKEEIASVVLMHSDVILSEAKNELVKNGCKDPVSLSYGKSYFNEKRNSSFAFPSGEYDAIRITIGKGEGENWWGVMYPSFSMPDEEKYEKMKHSLSSGEFSIITSDKPSVILRFKTVDCLMKMKEKIKSIRSEM